MVDLMLILPFTLLKLAFKNTTSLLESVVLESRLSTNSLPK